MSQARTAPTKSALVYLLLLVGSAIFSIPFLWTLSTALKTHANVFSQPPQIWPHPIAWDNFSKAWTALPFTSFVLNTIMLAVVCTSAQVVTGSLVAYGFARFSFRGSKLLFGVLLSTMMLPGQVSMIPVFLIWRDLRAIDTYWPLIVPAFFGGGAFNIFLLRQFFVSIPRELDEAAMIDGAGYPQIWWRVLMPLSGPALATVAVFSFIGHWDDFMGPLIYLNSPEKYTVAVGLRMFQDSYGTDLEQVMAASVIHILPVVVLFFCAQRYFLRGINLTGMGGR
jgi:multiple sugar transport system permease protein